MKPVLVTELGFTGCVGNGSCDDWPLVLFAAHAMPQPQGPLPRRWFQPQRSALSRRPVMYSISTAATRFAAIRRKRETRRLLWVGSADKPSARLNRSNDSLKQTLTDAILRLQRVLAWGNGFE